jgi:malate dehydrogenase (oxaloacetate-decarboxylating)
MKEAGSTEDEARDTIWMIDRHGLVTEAHEHLEEFKRKYARKKEEYTHDMNLLELVRTVKPTILIGVSATKDIFTKEVIEAMSSSCDRPILFPLSNPTSKSECTPENALRWSCGKAIVATGSPFDPVVFNGKI